MPKKKTYKYNLYKITKTREDALFLDLSSKGLEVVNETTQGPYTVRFLLCSEPDILDDIWWVAQFGSMIPEDRQQEIANRSHFGLLIITSDEVCYAIPLGKSHFYLREYAEPDFGIELACRIADEKSVKVVNTRSFGSKKTKSIDTFMADSSLDMDSGESLDYISADTIDPIKWGKAANFGTSALLNVLVPPEQMNELIDAVEIVLQQPCLFTPPRAKQVKNKEIIAELDEEVGNALSNASQATDTVDIASFQLSGIEFIFRGDHGSIIKGPYGAKSNTIHDLDITSLRQFAQDRSLPIETHWSNFKIQHLDETGRGTHSEKLRNILSYVTTKDNRNYFLKDGKWFEFSESYVEKLLESAAEVGIINRDTSADLDVTEHTAWQQANPTASPNYKEYWYNTCVLVTPSNGLIAYDRNNVHPDGYTLEPLDVYDPAEERFIFVKRWKPSSGVSDFAYLVDQATTSIKLLRANNEIDVAGTTLKCRKAQLLLVVKGRDIRNITDIRSLIVLQKINAFKSDCRRKNIVPELRFQAEIN